LHPLLLVDFKTKGFSMSEVPKTGGWYQDKIGTRVVVVGMASKFRAVVEHECGTIGFMGDWSEWRHLPGCTGWAWKEPCDEVFPQYYPPSCRSIDQAAFIRRDSPSRVVTVRKDGSEVLWSSDWAEESDGRKEITKSDAISRLNNSRGYDKAIEVPRSWEMDLIEKLQKRVDRLEAAERRERAMGAVQ
jgi:hypothetical protein